MRNIFYFSIILSVLIFISCDGDRASSLISNPIGKGGSMARFALYDSYLYVVDNENILVYALDAKGAMQLKRNVSVGFGIETIAVRATDLFLGANDAMYIYDLSDPQVPVFVSRYNHIMACDPVVVNGNYAYVTLRIRASCRAAGSDALEIIDIHNKSLPTLVKSYAVNSPYGLGVDGNVLFLCEGDNGLKIFNIADPKSIVEVQHYAGINSFDVIPNNGVLIMTGDDGIFQYDYANLSDVHLLSHIKVQ